MPLLCLKISTPFTFCAFFKIDPPKLSLFENCPPPPTPTPYNVIYDRFLNINKPGESLSVTVFIKSLNSQNDSLKGFCPVCAACVASLVALTSADMFPRSQSSQIPACMWNQHDISRWASIASTNILNRGAQKIGKKEKSCKKNKGFGPKGPETLHSSVCSV